MLTSTQIAQFNENGYLLIPSVLTAAEVQVLRSSLRPKFDSPELRNLASDDDQYLVDIFSRYPELRWLLFHPLLLGALRALLGEDFVVLRESVAQFQSFGGWHKDTSSQERAGHLFHWDEDYLMVEAAFYLQDNTVEFGGGLDVEPGSHMQRDEFVRPAGFLTRAVRKLTGRREHERGISIPSKAGDLVIFHFRINHRATPRKLVATPMAHMDQQKLAVFIACSRNNRHVSAYHDFIAGRATYEYLKEFSYPPELIEEGVRQGVKLA